MATTYSDRGGQLVKSLVGVCICESDLYTLLAGFIGFYYLAQCVRCVAANVSVSYNYYLDYYHSSAMCYTLLYYDINAYDNVYC